LSILTPLFLAYVKSVVEGNYYYYYYYYYYFKSHFSAFICLELGSLHPIPED